MPGVTNERATPGYSRLGRWRRVLSVARRELRTPPPVEWQLVDPAADGASFAGRNVVVTGAAGLIGTGLVSGFLAAGASVVALDMDEEGLDRLADSVGPDASDRLTTVVADLRDVGALDRVADSTPSLDVLVHCAGRNDLFGDVSTTPDESWSDAFRIHVSGPARLTGAFASALASGAGGSIVFITSINASSGSKWPTYSTTKAAAAKLVDDLALQLAPVGVRVNAVVPGFVLAADDAGDRRSVSAQPLGSCTVPVEAIVHAVLFLGDTTRSPMTTGQHLTIDGGATMVRAGLAGEVVRDE